MRPPVHQNYPEQQGIPPPQPSLQPSFQPSYRQQILREYIRYTNDFNRNMNQYIQATTSVLEFYQDELSNSTRDDYEREQREQRELTETGERTDRGERGERRTPLRGSMRVTGDAHSVRRADRREREIERRQIGVASPTTPTVRLREEDRQDMQDRQAPTPIRPHQTLLPPPPPPTTQVINRDPMNDLLTNELGTIIDRVFGNMIAPNTQANLRPDNLVPLEILRWDIPLNFNGLWNTGVTQPTRPTIPSFQDISAALMPVELVDFTDPDTPDDEHLDPIDLRAFTAEDSIVQIRACGHRFRRETIMNAFRYDARCPVCRRDIRDSPVVRTTPQIPAQTPAQTTPLPPPAIVAPTTTSSRPPTPIPQTTPVFPGLDVYDRVGDETPSTPSDDDDDDDGDIVE